MGPGMLTALALLLPFEARRPLLHLRYLEITGVELLLYAVLLVWGIGWAAGRWRGWSVGHTGVAVFAMVILLSAFLAPHERTAAFKFALRSLGGCVLFFAAADMSEKSEFARRHVVAVVLGASISALAGCAEAALPRVAGLLSLFKTQPSMIGGYLRASGTFQYANIGAMYWEAAAPLALALAIGTRERSTRAPWPFIAALALLVEATMLSMSRAAIFLALALPAVCLLCAKLVAPVRRSMLAVCGLAVALPLLSHVAFAPAFRLRMRTPGPSAWYRVGYSGVVDGMELDSGQALLLTVKARNLGAMTWPSSGVGRITLSYHWEDPRRDGFIVWDGQRTDLPVDVLPGDEVQLSARVQAPNLSGNYVLVLDMAHEGATWFSLQGSPGVEIPVFLRTPASGGVKAPEEFPLFKPEIVRPPTRAELWRTALKMWEAHPVVGVGPDNFRHMRGFYQGLADFDRRIHSNNLYIEMLANLGSLGLLSFSALLVSLVVMLRRLWSRALTAELKWLTLGLGASMAAFCLHGFGDYFFEFTPTYCLFWLVTGVIAGIGRPGAGK